jgi:hypothetical protein
MFSNIRSCVPAFILVWLSFGLLLTGCAQTALQPDVSPTDPFSLRTEAGEGIVVEWSGNSRGHRPGSESVFDFQMVNNGQQPWSGEYCFQLVDKNGLVENFNQANYNLETGQGFSTQLRFSFSEDLQEKPYALVLIIPEQLASLVTIYVGDSHNQTAGPWPAMQAGCP